jgi:hypothetical protein
MINWFKKYFKSTPKIKYDADKEVYELLLDKDLVIRAPNNTIYFFSNNMNFQTHNGVINLNPLPVYDSNDVDLVYYHNLCIEYRQHKQSSYLQEYTANLDLNIETENSCNKKPD